MCKGMLQGVFVRRLMQIRNHCEWQHREYITHSYLPLLVTNWSAREKIVCVLERKTFW
jgi:hypothetical protein